MRCRSGLLLATAWIVLGACASTSTRELTQKELEIFGRLQTRLQTNRKALSAALKDLGRISEEATIDLHSLSLSLSKAQLLESMKSPWVNPHPDLAVTQKEVAFYQLFALADAEQELLGARLRQRRGEIDQVLAAYDRLSGLLARAVEAEKIILAHLNQPSSAQFSAFVGTLLAETKAFRETLSAADNPRLKALAGRVTEAEKRVAEAQQAISSSLQALSIGGDD